jgi:hypothetical protein
MPASLTPKDHTSAVLKRMNLAGSIPGNLDRNNDAQADNYGLASARSSDASSFKLTGAPKSPHMGRPGRQAGGRISGDLVRTRRTPRETAADIADEERTVQALAKDRATGGRIGRSLGGSATAKDEYTQAGRTMTNEDASGKDRFTGGDFPPSHASGGRVGRAHGGRTAKGKTTVNVIIGGQKANAPTPPMPPPPMAAPGPVGPPRPPPVMPPPGGPPGGMPMGGAPPGMAGASPPGAPPMLRARGGRIEAETAGRHDFGKAGVHSFGKGGTRAGVSLKREYGSGSGLGRMEIARKEK